MYPLRLIDVDHLQSLLDFCDLWVRKSEEIEMASPNITEITVITEIILPQACFAER